MADEAVVRILLEGGGASGGGGGGGGGAGGAGGGRGRAGGLSEEQREERDRVRLAQEAARNRLRGARAREREAARDAKERLDAERSVARDLARAAGERVREEAAQARQEAKEEKERVGAAQANARMRARARKDKERQEAREEADRLREGKAAARLQARAEAEARKRRARAYDEANKSSLGEVAASARGLLGGIFGPAVGGLLDVFAGINEARTQSVPAGGGQTTPSRPPALPGIPTTPGPTPVAPAGPPGGPPRPIPIKPGQAIPARNVKTAAQVAAGGGGGPGGGVAAGGGLLAGAAAAVPVAAAVIAAMSAIKSGAEGAARGLADFATSIASPDADPSKYTELIGRTLSTFGDKLFYISPALSIVPGALGEAVQGLSRFTRALDGVSDRYRKFSGPLAVAEAQGKAIQTLGDVRRAQEIGPQLAVYVQQRTQMQQKFEDAKIRMISRMLPVALTLMEKVEQMLPLLELLVSLGTDGAEALLKMAGFGDDIAAMRKKITEAKVRGGVNDMTRILMNTFLPGPRPPGAQGVSFEDLP